MAGPLAVATPKHSMSVTPRGTARNSSPEIHMMWLLPSPWSGSDTVSCRPRHVVANDYLLLVGHRILLGVSRTRSCKSPHYKLPLLTQ